MTILPLPGQRQARRQGRQAVSDRDCDWLQAAGERADVGAETAPPLASCKGSALIKYASAKATKTPAQVACNSIQGPDFGTAFDVPVASGLCKLLAPPLNKGEGVKHYRWSRAANAIKPRSEMAGKRRADSELHELLRDKGAECTECAQLRADVAKLRKALEESERLQALQAKKIKELQELNELGKLGAQMLTGTPDKPSPKEWLRWIERKRGEPSLREFLKENASRYRSAAEMVRECDNGCSWSDAEWVMLLGVQLQEACRGTKYFDQRRLDAAKAVLEECNQGSNWTDAAWVAEEFLQKFVQIVTDGLL